MRREPITLMILMLLSALVSAAPAPGVTVTPDSLSRTGYTVTFALEDDGYESVKLSGNYFLFVPVLTEDTDFDNEYIPQMDERGMAIKGPDGKSIVEVGLSVAAEPDNIKADTLRVDSGELPVLYSPYEWQKEVEYEGTVTTLDHYFAFTTFDMEEKDGMWTVSMPLPSGAYPYSYLVTKDGATSSICDPADNEPWYRQSVPAEGTPGFEGMSTSDRQAFARLHESPQSFAYVPFDKDRQSYDWTFVTPVSTERPYEGTMLVDVPYSTPDGVIVNPEVAEAHVRGLIEADGTVDFLNDTGYLGIYLPKGYDPEREEPYKTVYFNHGGRGAQSFPPFVIRTADHAMEDGTDDFILVTYNCYLSKTDKAWPSWFDWKVASNIKENIIPFIEEHFNVVKDESGRAMVGYSAGAGVTHYMLLYYSDLFDYFGIFSGGESTTVPGDFNSYIKYVTSYDDYIGKGLDDEVVLIGVGNYDVARAGGYTVEGTKDAVQTIRYDHIFRAYKGLRDVVGVKDITWSNGHANHNEEVGSPQFDKFFNDYLWK